MAAHRKKPRKRPSYGTALRRAVTLALAGAATATTGVLDGTAGADPGSPAEQVKDEVDRLYQEAEVATEKYLGVKERTRTAQGAYERLQDEAARRTDQLNSARRTLGSYAAAQYRESGIDPGVKLALSADPDRYLAGTALADRVGDRQARAVEEVRREAAGLERLRKEAGDQRDRVTRQRAELRRHKKAVTDKLGAARRVLSRLTAAERERVATAGTAPATGPVAPAAGGSARARAAIGFAQRAIGSPYVWGATGPRAFDCSGLTQAAYRAAGVSLPRTTYTQVNAGRRVGRDELRPGDLVFFYPGVTHVGLYVGDGRMIHAPRPGSTVRIASVDEMPFAGATRVV
ncbi:NlpC/P60 family protein [Streptomyces sp. NPDC059816]|uniref:C40 family peptidase n=1 Tax=Streptomyces sp. NPDC059816 TaxID=3346960 RepID=UPI003667091B